MTQNDVRGQDEALALLRAALTTRHVGHAYLFHGPAGVGKTRAALWFARALLCEAPAADGTACGVCASCRAAAELRHPDLELLFPLPTFKTEPAPKTSGIASGRAPRREAFAWARACTSCSYALNPSYSTSPRD